MAITSTTTNMLLVLPTPGQQLGPTWATNLNTALELVDAHDHTSGKGKPIGVAAITIDGDVDFKPSTTAYPAANLSYLSFSNQDTAYAAANAVRLFSATATGELFWNDNDGNQIQLTAGGALNASGVESNRFAFYATELSGAGPTAINESHGKSVYMANTTSGVVGITLPAVGTVAGRFFTIKDIGGNAATNNITISVQTSASETVDGATSYVIASNYGSATFISRGNSSSWYVT